jgi:uncharacterized membrane protein
MTTAHPTALRIDWQIPLALLVLSAIPFAAGIARVAGLASSGEVNADNARFVAAPMPIVLHVIGASLFSILGALQFSTSFRLRRPHWHRLGGRIVAVAGALAALSGLWMTMVYPIPAALQGDLLYGVRELVSIGMLVSIATAVLAILHRDIATHRAWMIRAYALGLGAGTQVIVLLPWMLLRGTPSVWQRDLLMTVAWALNLLIAEWIIRRQQAKISFFYKVNL